MKPKLYLRLSTIWGYYLSDAEPLPNLLLTADPDLLSTAPYFRKDGLMHHDSPTFFYQDPSAAMAAGREAGYEVVDVREVTHE